MITDGQAVSWEGLKAEGGHLAPGEHTGEAKGHLAPGEHTGGAKGAERGEPETSVSGLAENTSPHPNPLPNGEGPKALILTLSQRAKGPKAPAHPRRHHRLQPHAQAERGGPERGVGCRSAGGGHPDEGQRGLVQHLARAAVGHGGVVPRRQ